RDGGGARGELHGLPHQGAPRATLRLAAGVRPRGGADAPDLALRAWRARLWLPAVQRPRGDLGRYVHSRGEELAIAPPPAPRRRHSEGECDRPLRAILRIILGVVLVVVGAIVHRDRAALVFSIP